MSFDLAICRFGGLAVFQTAGRAPLRPPPPDLQAVFHDQQKYICKEDAYLAAREVILAAARDIDPDACFAAEDGNDRHNQLSVFSMPPALDLALAEGLDHSSHLVGRLPADRLDIKIGDVRWIVRVQPSVTACALEVSDGIPKLWWTFEAVPKDPDPNNRPSEKDTIAFISFVRGLEKTEIVLNQLKDAYFGALKKVIAVSGLTFDMGDERLHIRFVDNNDMSFAALINALRYRKPLKGLTAAKKGMRSFREFVRETNAPDELEIDPSKAYVETEARIAGIEAVSARRDIGVQTSIAGIAQRPSARTAYDHLDIVREQRIAENEEQRVRMFSAARRLTGYLVGIEALKLEWKRLHGNTAFAPGL